jgi:hypothetical protein
LIYTKENFLDFSNLNTPHTPYLKELLYPRPGNLNLQITNYLRNIEINSDIGLVLENNEIIKSTELYLQEKTISPF